MKMVDAKSRAQQIAFAPLTFQAVRACTKFGLFKIIDDAGSAGATLEQIERISKSKPYTVSALLEAVACAGIIEFKNGKYYTSKIAQCFLYDEMTKINADFVHDVCYQGAFYLSESFEKGKPEGLKVFGGWPTVYEGLSELPEQVKRSWFAFDHFYSDSAFNDVIKIILEKNPASVYDIGCNTGKFELAMFSKNYKGTIVLCDLPQQLAKARENLLAAGFEKNCVFYPINVLKDGNDTQENAKSGHAAGRTGVCVHSSFRVHDFSLPCPDAVLMSQFLDCFSKEEIILILKKAAEIMDADTRLYILEPFWDVQKFQAAKLSLTHTSLYFTAIANGNSKMYAQAEMRECVEKAGLKVLKARQNIGSHEYTLLEVVKEDAKKLKGKDAE
jgi:SAM-dependent methyltransferase